MLKNMKMIITIFLAILVLVFGIRIVYINSKYPSQKNYYYKMNEDISFDNSNIKILSYRIVDPEFCREKLSDSDYEYLFGDKITQKIRLKVALVTLDVANYSLESLNTRKWILVSGGFRQGAHSVLASAFNENKGIVPPKTQAQITLGYIISDTALSEGRFETIDKQNFMLTYATMKVHYVIKLEE